MRPVCTYHQHLGAVRARRRALGVSQRRRRAHPQRFRERVSQRGSPARIVGPVDDNRRLLSDDFEARRQRDGLQSGRNHVIVDAPTKERLDGADGRGDVRRLVSTMQRHEVVGVLPEGRANAHELAADGSLTLDNIPVDTSPR